MERGIDPIPDKTYFESLLPSASTTTNNNHSNNSNTIISLSSSSVASSSSYLNMYNRPKTSFSLRQSSYRRKGGNVFESEENKIDMKMDTSDNSSSSGGGAVGNSSSIGSKVENHMDTSAGADDDDMFA